MPTKPSSRSSQPMRDFKCNISPRIKFIVTKRIELQRFQNDLNTVGRKRTASRFRSSTHSFGSAKSASFRIPQAIVASQSRNSLSHKQQPGTVDLSWDRAQWLQAHGKQAGKDNLAAESMIRSWFGELCGHSTGLIGLESLEVPLIGLGIISSRKELVQLCQSITGNVEISDSNLMLSCDEFVAAVLRPTLPSISHNSTTGGTLHLECNPLHRLYQILSNSKYPKCFSEEKKRVTSELSITRTTFEKVRENLLRTSIYGAPSARNKLLRTLETFSDQRESNSIRSTRQGSTSIHQKSKCDFLLPEKGLVPATKDSISMPVTSDSVADANSSAAVTTSSSAAGTNNPVAVPVTNSSNGTTSMGFITKISKGNLLRRENRKSLLIHR